MSIDMAAHFTRCLDGGGYRVYLHCTHPHASHLMCWPLLTCTCPAHPHRLWPPKCVVFAWAHCVCLDMLHPRTCCAHLDYITLHVSCLHTSIACPWPCRTHPHLSHLPVLVVVAHTGLAHRHAHTHSRTPGLVGFAPTFICPHALSALVHPCLCPPSFVFKGPHC
jgi:hypothetical protein